MRLNGDRDHVVRIEFKIQLRKEAFNLVLGWVYRGHSTPEFGTRLDQFGLHAIRNIKPPFSRKFYNTYLTQSVGVHGYLPFCSYSQEYCTLWTISLMKY